MPACPRSSRYWGPGCGDLGRRDKLGHSRDSAVWSGSLLRVDYSPHQFDVAYGIQPLLDSGTDGRGETVTVLVAVPQATRASGRAAAPISVKT